MYPQEELTLLAARKVALQARIFERRAECVWAIERVSRPLEWVDRGLAAWRRLSPMAKLAMVPLGILLRRWTAPRTGVLRTVLRWGPIVYGAVRGFAAAKKMSDRA